MAFNRRDFGKGVLGGFLAALVPLKELAEASPLTLPDRSLVLPPRQMEFDSPQAVEIPDTVPFETFAVHSPCLLGSTVRNWKLMTAGLTVDMPADPQHLRKHPALIRASRVVGTVKDVRAFCQLFGNINNEERMALVLDMGRFWFADTLCQTMAVQLHDPQLAQHPGLKVPDLSQGLPAWIFQRPVITSVGCCVESMSERLDVYGDNDGQPIPVDDADRMAIVDWIQFQTVHLPEETESYKPHWYCRPSRVEQTRQEQQVQQWLGAYKTPTVTMPGGLDEMEELDPLPEDHGRTLG